MTGFGRSFFLTVIVLFAVALMAPPVSARDAGAAAGVSAGQSETLSAQRRTRITVYPRQQRLGRTAKRHCEAWLVKEFRVSGPVIVPRQRCWWQ